MKQVLDRLAWERDWTLLPPTLSPTLATFIKQRLRKERKQRLPDIGAMRLTLEGERTAEMLLDTESEEQRRALSPDGRFLAHTGGRGTATREPRSPVSAMPVNSATDDATGCPRSWIALFMALGPAHSCDNGGMAASGSYVQRAAGPRRNQPSARCSVTPHFGASLPSLVGSLCVDSASLRGCAHRPVARLGAS